MMLMLGADVQTHNQDLVFNRLALIGSRNDSCDMIHQGRM